MMGKKIIILLSFGILFTTKSRGQTNNFKLSNQLNTVSTAVPFLGIDANAQSMGTGWIGVVASDLYSQNGLSQNPAMLARGKRIMGFQAINYVPWLRQLVPDINLFETGYYQSIDANNAVGISARYFSFGDVQFTDDVGNIAGTTKPYDVAIGLKYAHNFSEYFSMGTGIKYIHSDLVGNRKIGTVSFHPAKAIAFELGFDYRRDLIQNDEFNLRWNAGLAILNIGNRVTFTTKEERNFIPQTIKLGTLFTLKQKIINNTYVAFDISYQANKLLVPTPPIFARDANDQLIPDGKGGFKIEAGMNPDVSALRGIIQSFYDAPGGFGEELREIIHQFGSEARINMFDNKMLLAARGGYFLEHATKGNRKFKTLGMGLGIAGFRLDAAYLIPNEQRHPLQDTFTISFGARFNLNKENFFRFIE